MGKRTQDIGEGFIRECENCARLQLFRVIEQRSQAGAFFIPLITARRTYYEMCPDCHHGQRIGDRQAAVQVLVDAVIHNSELEEALVAGAQRQLRDPGWVGDLEGQIAIGDREAALRLLSMRSLAQGEFRWRTS